MVDHRHALLRNSLVAGAALILGSAAVGCASEEAPRAEAVAEAPGAAPAADTPPPTAATSPAAPSAPSAPGTPSPTQDGEDGASGDADPAAAAPREPGQGVVTNTENLERVGRTIEGALAAAAQASAGDDGDECSRAYTGLVVMVERVRAEMPQQAGTRGVPPRDRFMEVCHELAPELQRCLSVGYAMQHQVECRTATANMDPEQRARVEAMMTSGATAP